ncbi:hypothetical protein [Fictibacillus sp. KU28468]|uniref:hypothetical protein n=1 Tax=Fictibacillus sp. KU28468 TaxID=2991053 RepID=UPI00223DF3D7|nr:hypothetical protein [Fictibacillus sp. KU28468]UZJ78609.1 hypothetical protein OKX00_21230 [Fictibacillus sp. KU28468]
MITIEIFLLQKLLRKAMIYQLMIKINKLIKEANLTHKEISEQTGRSGNWVNRVYNNSSDITMSSLSKIISVISEKIELDKYNLNALFDQKTLKIASTMSSLADENSISATAFILSEKELFSDLMGDWGALSERKKLSKKEKAVFEKLQKLLKDPLGGI